ncbi:nitrogenase cofactor biosynthesis protein NifB [Vibrio agarivorans]|uniref:nitrogenase cofactor biosynthesis protein NifB n=1 Tax=Vibrio agarivorans TaxID=153622 RepID=UPI0025B4B8BA|nr:nitrogenase cofactor biosynthesis protein NifB [Vibrio agarivorans]MDN3663407.1 nitrogenase cofactor biosynthesis protein NifB [Vibrio agarivorans]
MESLTHSVPSNVTHFIGQSTQERIAQHPCYSKNASQYARIHLPVAPACNIQCNYCNRKFDCSNESRPGVVSHLLQPMDALTRFHIIKQRMDNLTVVGIAGPGDALANPKQTFQTLKLIKEADPKVQLCISTNGLALPSYVEELAAVGVNHLTITINTVDPKIAAKIYPWIFWEHKRIKGLEAGKILIEQQLKGLKLASAANMLVKVNTVLIPGVNDHHIQTLSQTLKEYGGFIHNIMPLIAQPEHGTFYGLNHYREPSEDELALARESSVLHMPQMTHCQQCRADAVGTIDSPCSSKTERANYRVAVANTGSEVIDTHFGHATQLSIYDLTPNEIRFVETRSIDKYCQGASHCDQISPIEAIHDCKELLCTRIGHTPWQQLEQAGIRPNVDFAFMSSEQALKVLAQNIEYTEQHAVKVEKG